MIFFLSSVRVTYFAEFRYMLTENSNHQELRCQIISGLLITIGLISDPLPRPSCNQLYNLFYPSDPSAVRLEPLLNEKFTKLAPMKVARYQKFPLGDGQSVHVGRFTSITTSMYYIAQLVKVNFWALNANHKTIFSFTVIHSVPFQYKISSWAGHFLVFWNTFLTCCFLHHFPLCIHNLLVEF